MNYSPKIIVTKFPKRRDYPNIRRNRSAEYYGKIISSTSLKEPIDSVSVKKT